MEMVECKVTGFVIRFDDSNGGSTKLEIPRSDYAGQILRGLIHSGFMVTIQEAEITVMKPKSDGPKLRRGYEEMSGIQDVARGVPTCDPEY